MGIGRSTVYYKPVDREKKDIESMKFILEEYNKHPFYGYRKIALDVKKNNITEKQVRRLMKSMGLQAIYPKPNLSISRKEHKKYPYLLRNKKINFPNQVWATDITYIKLNGSYVYLIAIIDLYSRKVLTWKLSNTMDADFCVEALEDAILRYGIPAIFNTDQGSQFTSEAFISVLEKNEIRISMDGKGRALDNIYVERLWRSLKYEEIYLKSYENLKKLKEGIKKYFHFFNGERYHQSLNYDTPDEVYYACFSKKAIGKQTRNTP